MKHLKRFTEQSSVQSSTGNESTKPYYINGTYTINEDGSYDVEGDVNLFRKNLTKLPIKFGKVSGYFDCSDNKLTSLDGCPTMVGSYFDCSYNNLTNLEGSPEKVFYSFLCSNNKLINLEGSPIKVAGIYDCSMNKLTNLVGCADNIGVRFDCSNNKLISLEGGPKKVGKTYECYSNNLTSLIGSPKEIGEDFNCFSNKLTSLIGCPKCYDCNFLNNDITDFKGLDCEIVNCLGNPIHEIYQLCPTKKFIDDINEYSVIRGNKILLDRLEDALYQAGKDDIDVSKLKFKNYITI
jgi:hypothetical protein